MALDPICNMEFEEEKAVATAVYEGKNYYFCSEACKNEFLRTPWKYESKASSKAEESGHSCCS
ncbi:YHS domain-containing protein [Spirochaeta lutea]|jgi:YHS domain-containing protein|uniref:TRASH domain-containing protein n=1 Tax=Spirochaeta lutea TaxID=1480694 RepID=A0A098QW10_9SPIO|nr:YHS domain-containing protein [Spirochaeta lutea]KGE71756.1 hypothetical protein DC28_11015 [Spirochaeta lutea]